MLAESASTAVRNYIGNRTIGYVFEADYPKQKGHFSPQGNQWKSKWHYTRKSDNRSMSKTKVLGSTARMTYEEAKQKHEQLMAQMDLSPPKRLGPLSKMALRQLVLRVARRAG